MKPRVEVSFVAQKLAIKEPRVSVGVCGVEGRSEGEGSWNWEAGHGASCMGIEITKKGKMGAEEGGSDPGEVFKTCGERGGGE